MSTVIPVSIVEHPDQIVCHLHVLNIVFPHWDRSGLVKEDVGALKDRVREQPKRDVLQFLGLLLELGHAVEHRELERVK